MYVCHFVEQWRDLHAFDYSMKCHGRPKLSTIVHSSTIQESSVKKQTLHNNTDRAGMNNIHGIKK